MAEENRNSAPAKTSTNAVKKTEGKLSFGKRVGKWMREMRSELKKVVWPTPQKVAKNTGTVILCTAVIGAFIWIFDGVAGLFIRTILDVFG